MRKITFRQLEESEYSDFSKETIAIFSIAVAEAFGQTMDSDNDIESSLNNSETEVYAIYDNDEKVGGIAIRTDR